MGLSYDKDSIKRLRIVEFQALLDMRDMNKTVKLAKIHAKRGSADNQSATPAVGLGNSGVK